MNQEEYKKYFEENKHKIKHHPNSWVGYCPREIKSDNAIMRCFSQNILFGRYTGRDGKPVFATALYMPDFSSFKTFVEVGQNYASMDYHNQRDHRAKVVMKCCFLGGGSKKYEANKYFEGKWIGIATGVDDWEKFFIQVSFLGFVEGEAVEYHEV